METGVAIYTLLCIQYISDETHCPAQGHLLSAQWGPKWEGNSGMRGCMYVWLIHLAEQQKLTPRCKGRIVATVLLTKSYPTLCDPRD